MSNAYPYHDEIWTSAAYREALETYRLTHTQAFVTIPQETQPMSGIDSLLIEAGLDPSLLEIAKGQYITSADYYQFQIPKATGGMRKITAPTERAKKIQTAILRILERAGIQGSDAAHAYYHGRSISSMADPHIGRKWLIKIDLKDFFHCITAEECAKLVRQAITRGGRPEYRPLARSIGALVQQWCGSGGLIYPPHELRKPGVSITMGAPTSPFLSNLYASEHLDRKMIGMCRTFHIRGMLAQEGYFRTQPIFFSRYADDLCFSSDYRYLPKMIPFIKRTIKGAKLILNPKKIKKIHRTGRQTVCGVSVNEVKGKPLPYRRALRHDLHRIAVNIATGRCAPGYKFKFGSNVEIEPIDLGSLRGRVEHVAFLSDTQGESLRKLLILVEELHKPEQLQSSYTRQWVAERRSTSDQLS